MQEINSITSPRSDIHLVRDRLFLITSLFAIAVVLTTAAAVYFQYQTALESERSHLMQLAQSQASLMGAIIPSSIESEQSAVSLTDEQLAILIDSYQENLGFGETGELVLGERSDEQIHFIWRHRHFDYDDPLPVDWISDRAEPMRRALRGEQGTIVALDYRDVEVLAAYHPVPRLNLGIVAKIDLREFQTPFLYSLFSSLAVMLLILAFGMIALRILSRPIIAQEKAKKELDRSERRLQTIMDNSGDAIFLLNLQGIIQQVNKAAEEVFGYSGSELEGQPIDFLMSGDDAAKHPGYIGKYLQNRRGSRIIGVGAREVLGVSKSGEVIPFDLSVNITSIDDEEYFVGNLRDIRARKIERNKLLLAQKLDSVGQLTGGIAHDFNNLLTTIMGNLELLNLDLREKKHRDSVDAALKAASRGAELTKRLLTFAKKKTVAPSNTNIGEAITVAAELFRVSLGHHVELVLDLPEQEITTIADKAELENAILNLCLNAKDAMPTGGRIVVSAGIAEVGERLARKYQVEPGPYVSISVRDNGAGMSLEVMQQALEPFFTTKEFGSGSGLGLSMVYGSAEQLGGTVAIESEEGQGTKIEILIPHTSNQQEARSRKKPKVESKDDGRTSILVVDDDHAILTMTARILGGLDYTVYQASNCDEALRIAREHQRLDITLCDVVLANGERGPEVAKLLQSIHPEISILFMSGYTDGALKEHGQLAEIGLLAKPFSMSELKERLRAL